jgi:hypothetical protein
MLLLLLLIQLDSASCLAAHAGYIPYSGAQAYPLTFATEFKRPTPLPAKLQAVVDAAAKPGQLPVKACVLTGNGEKQVIVGTLTNA